MKKVFTVLITVLLTVSVFAQSPEKMSYQAVIRNASSSLVANQAVGMKISILQGSANGTAVYVETQTPTTNINGLVSIEIGAGTVVSGNFSTINWANGPYFIKTETDPSGNTSYNIIGTSQLLSVPYALHAKTAESISGSHYVGELYGGGVVFWVDHTGKHGLVVSMVDLKNGVDNEVWSNVLTHIGASTDWDGTNNTTAITGQGGHTNSGANLCANYTNIDYGTGVYSDWFLPSLGQLKHIWNNLSEVQKALDSDGNVDTTPILKADYWSSTEYYNQYAWYFYFFEGKIAYRTKDSLGFIRAVRAF